VRPATLDRVENDGSGSDINPREGKPKETTLDNRGHFRPVFIQSAAVLEAVKAGLETAECAAMAERRPAVTASARGGVGNLRSGQKKACGVVEQKKGPKQESKSARKKVLAFVAAIRERRNGPQIEQRN